MITECRLTKDIPIGGFVVFLLALFGFMYLMYCEYKDRTNGEKEGTMLENVWICIFFLLLVGCVVISVVCVMNTDNSITKSEMGKKLIGGKFKEMKFGGRRIGGGKKKKCG